MRHWAVGFGLWLALAGLVLGLFDGASCSEVVQERAIPLPPGPGPRMNVGDLGFREFLVTYDLPGRPGSPVVVVAKNREVWYVDGATLAILQRLAYDEDESVVVSPNGTYIAVLSRVHHRKTGKTDRSIRVEDWTGRLMWRSPFRLRVEPTPTGGLLVPIITMSGDWPDDAGILPESLLVYDDRGSVILEGLSARECRTVLFTAMSPEGQYLACLFRWIPPENRERRGNSDQDKVCLVLYDIPRGMDLWRYYFAGDMPGHLAVGPGAKRILCFVGAVETPPGPPPTNYKMFLFDQGGRLLAQKEIAGCDGIRPPVALALSPDGAFCGIATHDGRFHVLRTEDGSELWHWADQASESELGSPSLADDGMVAALHSSVVVGAGQSPRNIVLFGTDGQVLREINGRAGAGRWHWLGISADAKLIWAADADSLRLFGAAPERN